jgi:N-methylhydantoinase B
MGVFREIYQEGFIVPVVKLVSKGEVVRDVLKLLLANVRAKKEVSGDLMAQVAANTMGIRRLSALVDRYGIEVINFFIERLLEYSQQRVAAELDRLPRGDFEAEGWLDDDGIRSEPIHLKVRVSLDGKQVTFDFTGTDAQRAGPMNCNLTQTYTACVYVLKCLVDPDIPINEGFYQPIRVIAPEGSAVNATAPTAIVGGWEVSMRLCEILFKALAEVLPERVPAGTKGTVCQVGFGGTNPRNGDYYCFYETLAGGYGGRIHSDGPDAVQTHIQNTQNAPVEETELNYPVQITRYSLIPDSEGPGKFRGGVGLCREYQFVDHEPVFTTLSDRAKYPPEGLFGGESGRLARYLLISDGKTQALPSKGTIQVRAGDTVRIETCGGGGYGPAHERRPELVLLDVRNGKISPERARQHYQVVINTDNWSVDSPQTKSLRECE